MHTADCLEISAVDSCSQMHVPHSELYPAGEGLIMSDDLGSIIVQLAAAGDRDAQSLVSYALLVKAQQGDARAQVIVAAAIAEAARAGTPAAQTILGLAMIKTGDVSEGMDLLAKAGAQGDPVALNVLSRLLENSRKSSSSGCMVFVGLFFVSLIVGVLGAAEISGFI